MKCAKPTQVHLHSTKWAIFQDLILQQSTEEETILALEQKRQLHAQVGDQHGGEKGINKI